MMVVEEEVAGCESGLLCQFLVGLGVVQLVGGGIYGGCDMGGGWWVCVGCGMSGGFLVVVV